jgi:hypothetical protein
MKDEYTTVSKNREELERRLEEWIKFVQDRRINDLADNILKTELRTFPAGAVSICAGNSKEKRPLPRSDTFSVAHVQELP